MALEVLKNPYQWLLWFGILTLTPFLTNNRGTSNLFAEGNSSTTTSPSAVITHCICVQDCSVKSVSTFRSSDGHHSASCAGQLFPCHEPEDVIEARRNLEWEQFYEIKLLNNESELKDVSGPRPYYMHTGWAHGTWSSHAANEHMGNDDFIKQQTELGTANTKYMCVKLDSVTVPGIKSPASLSTCIATYSTNPPVKPSKEEQNVAGLELGTNLTQNGKELGHGMGYVCDESNVELCGGRPENALNSETTSSDLHCKVCLYSKKSPESKEAFGTTDCNSPDQSRPCNSWGSFQAALTEFASQLNDLFPDQVAPNPPGHHDMDQMKEGPQVDIKLMCAKFEGTLGGIPDVVGGSACVPVYNDVVKAGQKVASFVINFVEFKGKGQVCNHKNSDDCSKGFPPITLIEKKKPKEETNSSESKGPSSAKPGDNSGNQPPQSSLGLSISLVLLFLITIHPHYLLRI